MLSNGGAAEEGPEEEEQLVGEEEQVDEALIDKGEGIIGEEVADMDKAEDDVAGYHEESRVARCPPAPKAPTAQEVARHNLTHATCKSWCPFCVAGRKPNAHHRSIPLDRAIPLLVADFAYVRSTADSEAMPIFVAKLYPQRMVFAMALEQKGATQVNVMSLARFIREMGLTRFAYRSDQEKAVIA